MPASSYSYLSRPYDIHNSTLPLQLSPGPDHCVCARARVHTREPRGNNRPRARAAPPRSRAVAPVSRRRDSDPTSGVIQARCPARPSILTNAHLLRLRHSRDRLQNCRARVRVCLRELLSLSMSSLRAFGTSAKWPAALPRPTSVTVTNDVILIAQIATLSIPTCDRPIASCSYGGDAARWLTEIWLKSSGACQNMYKTGLAPAPPEELRKPTFRLRIFCQALRLVSRSFSQS